MKLKSIVIFLILVCLALSGCKLKNTNNLEDWRGIPYNTEYESEDDSCLAGLVSASMVSSGMFYYYSTIRDIKLEDIDHVKAINPDTEEEYSKDDITVALYNSSNFINITLVQDIKVDVVHKAHICIYDKNGKVLWHRLVDYDEKIDYFTERGAIYNRDGNHLVTIDEDKFIPLTPGS